MNGRRLMIALSALVLLVGGGAPAHAQWGGGRGGAWARGGGHGGWDREAGPRGGGWRGGGGWRAGSPAGGPMEGPRGYGGGPADGFGPRFRGGYGGGGGRAWRRGQVLPPDYRGAAVADPARYHLRRAPNGYGWVGDGRNAYLMQRSTGMVLDSVQGAYDPPPPGYGRRGR